MNRREITPGSWGKTLETLGPGWLVSSCKWAGLVLPVSAENCTLSWAFVSSDLGLVLELVPHWCHRQLACLSKDQAVIFFLCHYRCTFGCYHLGNHIWFSCTSQLLMRLLTQEWRFSGAHELVLDHSIFRTEAEGSASSSGSWWSLVFILWNTERVYWAPSAYPAARKSVTVSALCLRTRGNCSGSCYPGVPLRDQQCLAELQVHVMGRAGSKE